MATLLYDSGRAPLVVRLLCLLTGIVSFLIAANIVGRWALGVGSPGSGPLYGVPGIVAALPLGCFMTSVWFLRKRIYVDEAGQNVVIQGRWMFGRLHKRIPISSIASVRTRFGRTKASAFWDIEAVRADGRPVWLAQRRTAQDADATAQAIAEGIHRPVTQA